MGLYSITRSALWKLTGLPGDECKQLLDNSQYWAREKLTQYRDGKLRRLIEHCYTNVPYYRREMEARRLKPSDIQRTADLHKLPVLTKNRIRAHSNELLATTTPARSISWSKTGGTTGEPIRVAKTPDCHAWEGMCYERGLEWGGLHVDEPRVSLFGGSLGLGKPRLTSRMAKLLRPDLFVPAFELREDTVEAYVGAIRRSACRFLLGYASAIYRLARLCEGLGEQLAFTAVFPTAELLLPEWEETIRRAFACAVLPYYGCGEVNSLAFTPADGDAYRIAEEHVVVEVADDSGDATLSGEGRFLITDLDNHAMPIVRYQNGDAGKTSEPSNGSPFSRIERLDGRYNSFLITDKGALISGVIGTHVFREVLSVKAYQIIQEEPRRIVIKIVTTPQYTEADQRLIVALFSRYLGKAMRINLEKVPSLPAQPAGKAVFVINRCLDDARDWRSNGVQET